MGIVGEEFIKKVLTHEFEVNDEVQNFDDIITQLYNELPYFLILLTIIRVILKQKVLQI